MPQTLTLYLSDAQAEQVRALQTRWRTDTLHAAIREAIRIAAEESK